MTKKEWNFKWIRVLGWRGRHLGHLFLRWHWWLLSSCDPLVCLILLGLFCLCPVVFSQPSTYHHVYAPPTKQNSYQIKTPGKKTFGKFYLYIWRNCICCYLHKISVWKRKLLWEKKNGKPCGRETRKATRSAQKGSEKGHRAKTRPRSRLNPHWLLRHHRVRKMISRAKLCGMKNTLKKQLHIFIHISRQRPVNRWGRGEAEDGFLSVAHTDNVRRGSARAGGRR